MNAITDAQSKKIQEILAIKNPWTNKESCELSDVTDWLENRSVMQLLELQNHINMLIKSKIAQ
jgi:hypothetical protein